MIEGPGHVPMHKIKENVDKQLDDLPRGAVLHARAAGDRHRARLRPHHVGDRRGDDRLVRHGDALLRDAEGAPRACPIARTSRTASSPTRSRRTRPTWPRGTRARSERDDALSQARFEFRWEDQFNLSLDPDDGARLPRRDAAGAGRQGRALLLDVRAALLLDEDHRRTCATTRPRRGSPPTEALAAGLREKAAAFREAGQELYVGRRARRGVATIRLRVAAGCSWSLAVALAVAAAARPATIPGRPVPVDPAVIYAQMCARCHGVDGRGDPGDPEDAADGARLSRSGVPGARHQRRDRARRSWPARGRCRRSAARSSVPKIQELSGYVHRLGRAQGTR